MDVNYISYTLHSQLICSSICAKRGCWLFTWDDNSMECGVFDDTLNAKIYNVPAPLSLKTYFRYTINGKQLVRSLVKDVWNNVKTNCENLGGQLYYSGDVTRILLLHNVLGEDRLWVGIYRIPGETIFRDINGQQILYSLPWLPSDPNFENQFSIGYKLGGLADFYATVQFYGICEI
ncbi:hypothetical protein SK128_007879 [Halocaridina rubra]|uniref:C-type lectin domain-containing protein n=1 Tax=Halocaridina rubra TaxID=373956 RepID=A0AAN9AFS8_HALRR